MMKIVKGKLVVTGRDEKMIKQEAKKLKISPNKLLKMVVRAMADKFTMIGKDILIEKL
jgi:hypothetical protein